MWAVMSDPLGLSVGTTNLVAARVGNQPVTRRSVLTLPNSSQTINGFVERVGDRVPLVTPDGKGYHAEQLLVTALEAMVQVGGGPSPDITIAIPAYWGPSTVWALQSALGGSRTLSRTGEPVRLISDAVAALTALQANPGMSANGVIALLDFGGSGTSITLADAASSFAPIGETMRYPDFSGDLIDQALLSHVLDNLGGDVDPAGTAAVGSLTRLRDECQLAKERLSADTATQLVIELPGYRADIRVTRNELQDLIRPSLDGVIAALDEMTERAGAAPNGLAAIAIVGGGAGIPFVTQRLSEHSRLPVVTTPQPAVNAAVGAALFAAFGANADAEAPTGSPPPPPTPMRRRVPRPLPLTRPPPQRCSTALFPTNRALRRSARWRGRRRRAATSRSPTPAKTHMSYRLPRCARRSTTCLRRGRLPRHRDGRGPGWPRWLSGWPRSSRSSPSAAWHTR